MKQVIADLKAFSREKFHVQSQNVEVAWAWYAQSQGLVAWTFTNTGSSQASVILLRNGYYFGGAFWPVYVGNSGFSTTFTPALTPLVDNGIANNSPPLAVLSFGGKLSVGFVFTLAPGQKWSMVEGGFSQLMTPNQITVYEVTESYKGPICIGYDQQRVIDWDVQTGTTLQGYSPNPSTFQTVTADAGNAPLDFLPYTDSIVTGTCAGSPTPTPTPTCQQEITNGLNELSAGQTEQGITDIIAGIECYFTTGVAKELHLAKLEELVGKARGILKHL